MEKVDLYENYTSTSVLFEGDEKKKTEWSLKYFKKYILPHLPQNRNSRILEIGCGYGRYTKAMGLENYSQVTGIDISEEQITYAKQVLGLNNVYKSDAIEYISSITEKVDCIIIMDVLEHLDNEYTISLLRQANKVLKKDGRLILHVPNNMAPLSPSFNSDITHVRAFSCKSMAQLLRMCGFQSFEHKQLPPLAHSITSSIRNIVWNLVIKQMIRAFMTISYGSSYEGIYTDNLLTIAYKNEIRY